MQNSSDENQLRQPVVHQLTQILKNKTSLIVFLSYLFSSYALASNDSDKALYCSQILDSEQSVHIRLVDAKDIPPIGLYIQDKFGPYWNKINMAIRVKLDRYVKQYLNKLNQKYETQYGSIPSPKSVRENIERTIEEIHYYEKPEVKEKLIDLIRLLTQDRFGTQIMIGLSTSISLDMPSIEAFTRITGHQQKQASHSGSSSGPSPSPLQDSQANQPHLSTDPSTTTSIPNSNSNSNSSKLGFFIIRRELYNLLAQAEGWSAMTEMVENFNEHVLQIDPKLADLYAEFDLNYRLLMFMMLSESKTINSLQSPLIKEQMAFGREVVCIDCINIIPEKKWPYNSAAANASNYFKPSTASATAQSKEKDRSRAKAQTIEDEESIQIIKATGIAVGINAWALVHEAFKAAFQMRTSLEATQRASLSPAESELLNSLTNSSVAEIRQSLYGIGFKNQMEKFIYTLTGSSRPNTYLSVLERVFSLLPPDLFNEFILAAFTHPYEQPNNLALSKSRIWMLYQRFNPYLNLDEFKPDLLDQTN